MYIRIRKGLDIPIAGVPEQRIYDAAAVRTVAVAGIDTPAVKPGMAVSVGDRVRAGQTLYVDKQHPDVRFTAPGAGEIVDIHRGARRVLHSVVVRLDGDEAERFDSWPADRLGSLADADVERNLLAAGLWPSFRTRPYSRIPPPGSRPAAIFVTAIDTNPLAPDPAEVVAEAAAAFARGLEVVATLADGKVWICTARNSTIPCPGGEPFRHAEFSGPHPAGLPGTHIHFLEPVGADKTVWHIGYQDVIACGELFTSGHLPTTRVISLAGPMSERPRLLRTRFGASIGDLLEGEVKKGRVRVVTGSVLNGRRAAGGLNWLGRYDNQLTVLAEGSEREFLAWLRPGTHKYSSERAYAGHFVHRGRYALTTSQNGSPRAMVPIGSFERVMPLDILPTPLLKALLVGDTDKARELGCLELDEEDLALCSFVCNGKYEYGPFLRETLDDIEAHG